MGLPLMALAQQGSVPPTVAFLTPGDNFVLENIPPIPVNIAESTARYGEFRRQIHPIAKYPAWRYR